MSGRDAAIWVVAADGSGAPRIFIDGGLSPAVVRLERRLATARGQPSAEAGRSFGMASILDFWTARAVRKMR